MIWLVDLIDWFGWLIQLTVWLVNSPPYRIFWHIDQSFEKDFIWFFTENLHEHKKGRRNFLIDGNHPLHCKMHLTSKVYHTIQRESSSNTFDAFCKLEAEFVYTTLGTRSNEKCKNWYLNFVEALVPRICKCLQYTWRRISVICLHLSSISYLFDRFLYWINIVHSPHLF